MSQANVKIMLDKWGVNVIIFPLLTHTLRGVLSECGTRSGPVWGVVRFAHNPI